MLDEVMNFQMMAMEMNINGLITDQELNILESLTENMTIDSDALELTTILTMSDLKDKDIVDCILAGKFDTATMILY